MNYYPGSRSTENEIEPAVHVSLWHRFRPSAGDGHTSLLFWLTVLALGSVSLLSVTWIASAALAKKGSEKLLRVDLLLPKLKSIHGERKATAFRMSEPEPSDLAHPKERKTSAPAHLLPVVIEHPTGTTVEIPHHAEPHAATPEPPPFASSVIPPLIVPPPMVETCDDPVVFLPQCNSPRGDSPMIRNWKTLTMYSLLSAAAVALAPPPPMVFAEEKKSVPAKVVDEKAMQDLVERVAALENKKLTVAEKEAIGAIMGAELKKLEDGALANLKQDVKAITTGVGELTKEIAALKTEQLLQKIQIENQKSLINQLSKRLEAGPTAPIVDKAMLELLKDIKDGIAKLGPTAERKMFSAPNGAAATMGRINLVNLYKDDLLFIINGARHRVPAGASRLIENLPVGAVTIEVAADRFGLFDRQFTTLTANETFTLTAVPRP